MSCLSYSDILKMVPFLVLTLCLMGCKPALPSAEHKSFPAVQTLTVHEASPEKIIFVGTYAASRVIPLAPTQAGRITAILVVSGQYVHQGDVLAALEDRLLLEIEAQAQGELDSAQAEMKQAAAMYKRSKGLDSIGGLSSGVVEERLNLWRAAQGKYKSAYAALVQAKIQVAEAKIRAPEDGRVISVKGVPGRLVGAGNEIIRLTAGEPEVHFKLPSSTSWMVGNTANVYVSPYANSQPVPALIKEIGPVDDTSQMQDVKLRLGHALPVGINSLVTIALAPHVATHITRVPLTALIAEGPTQAHIWGLTEGQEAHLVLRHVQIVGLRGADALVAGLTNGERIVTNSDGSFLPNQVVQVVSQASEL